MDRRKLAEALIGATLETLREDSEVFTAAADKVERTFAELRMVVPDSSAEMVARWRRASALALVIAHADTTSDARIEQVGRGDYLILDVPIPPHNPQGYGGCELLPALAHLLTGEEG